MQTETGRGITNEDFDIILQSCWEQVALFAFEQYKTNGRGAVFLDRQGCASEILNDQVDLGYSVYEPGRPDPDAARMIEAYDPAWEIVFQYLRPDGQVRTTRIRTASGNRHPWRIYLFERMLQDETEEEGNHETKPSCTMRYSAFPFFDQFALALWLR